MNGVKTETIPNAALIERMRAQLHVWEDEEPHEDWWTYQREYGEAFQTLEWVLGMLRELERYSPGELGNLIVAQTARQMHAKVLERLAGVGRG